LWINLNQVLTYAALWTQVIKQFDKEFQKQSHDAILQTFTAAIYLDIEGLQISTAHAILHDVQLYQKARSSSECLDALRQYVRAADSDLEAASTTLDSFDLVSLRLFLEAVAFSCQVRLERRDFAWDAALQEEVGKLWKLSSCTDVPLEVISRFVLDLASMGLLSKVGDGKFRFGHLTMQEYLAASCAVRLFGRDAQELLEQLCTTASGLKSPLHSSWTREVLQFTACMLQDTEQVTFTDFCSAVLESDDGTGTCCELVRDFLKERGSCEAVEQMLRDKMQKIRGTDLLLAGLCHPSSGMRSLVLSEMIQFCVPPNPFSDGTVPILKEIAEDKDRVWHTRAASMLSIAQIAQMKHWESFRSDRAETIRWMLEMLESDTDALKNVHFALIKALGTILKQDAGDSDAIEGIKLRQEDESVVLQPGLRENVAVEFNMAVANALSDLGLCSEALVDWLQDKPSLIAEGRWPIRHVQFLCERVAVWNDFERAVRLADSLLHRLHSSSFIQSDRLLLLKGLDNVRGLLSEGALSRMMFPFLEVGDAEQRARVLEAAVELKMQFGGQETSSNLARCLLLDVMPKSASDSTKISLLSYILEKEGEKFQESSLRENSAVFVFLLNSMQQSIVRQISGTQIARRKMKRALKKISIVAEHLLEFEGAHDEQKNKQVEEWPGHEGREGGGKSDQSKPTNEPQAFYSMHSRADAEFTCALDDVLKRFTPDILEKASSTWSTTEHVCEHYYAASLWTGSGLLQDTSAEKIATWLRLNKEDSVLVQDTYAALKHLQEPCLRGVAGVNGEWETQICKMLQFEALGPFVFGILLSHIRDKTKAEPSSALERFTLLSETIQQWDADTDDKRLERQFLLKELCIGRRDEQLPTWSGAVTKQKAPMRSPFAVLFVGANIEHHAQLKVREECQTIRKELYLTFGEEAWRPVAEFRAACFADPASFMHDVTEIGPGILHFSCDSETRGRWFAQGFKEASAIIDALRAHNRHVEAVGGQRIQLVVINACMSGPLAQALCEFVDFVIGHAHSEVGDEDALAFSKTLYYSLGRGYSLDASFKAAKLASEPFQLHRSCNPEQFFLPAPGQRLVQEVQDQSDRDCNELVRFLKGKGLSAIAARFSEVTGIELVEDLEMLQAEDLEGHSFLTRFHKQKLMKLALSKTAASASLRDDDIISETLA
jgi:hypothetical protein